MPPHPTIRRALLSAYDKTGLVDFARVLHEEFAVELISTGGTARRLRDADLPVTLVEQVTGFPELMDGRVKSLHPKIHAGILADRDNPEHMRQLAEQGIKPIDLVLVSLYPFEHTIARPDCAFADAIEMIDIGGPCLLRAAAKNHQHVLVECAAPAASRVLDYLRNAEAPEFAEFRQQQARAVYAQTALYDSRIASWLAGQAGALPTVRLLALQDAGSDLLRYGENPHQRGEVRTLGGSPSSTRRESATSPSATAHKAPPSPPMCGVVGAEIGLRDDTTRMSFNNYADASAALELCADLTRGICFPAASQMWHRFDTGAPEGPPKEMWHQFETGATSKEEPGTASKDETGATSTEGIGATDEAEAALANEARVPVEAGGETTSKMAAACFIKHTNACGSAVGPDPVEAYRQAYLGDPNAAMGGILAVNFPVDAAFAEVVMETYQRFGKPLAEAGHPHPPGAFFVEVWLAPRFDEDAVQLIRGELPDRPQKPWGRRVRLLAVGDLAPPPNEAELDAKHIAGGMLMQSRDALGLNEEQWQAVSAREPTPQEWHDLRLAWLVCKHTKSNAITLCKDGMLIGNGAGQMSRVMSCRIATWLAAENGHDPHGAAAASDAFFPFRDGPDVLADAGVTALIEPGGSKRDEEVIAAADERGLALVFTSTRHFRH